MLLVLKGGQVGEESAELMNAGGTGANIPGSLPRLLNIYDITWSVSLGASGACLLAVAVLAAARTEQRFRKDDTNGKREWWRMTSGTA